jgi:hypothetical protein
VAILLAAARLLMLIARVVLGSNAGECEEVVNRLMGPDGGILAPADQMVYQ